MFHSEFHQFLTALVAYEVLPYEKILDIRVSDEQRKMRLISGVKQVERSVRKFAMQYRAATAESIETGVILKKIVIFAIDTKLMELDNELYSIIANHKVEALEGDLNDFSHQMKFEIVILALKGNTHVVRPNAEIEIVLKKKSFASFSRNHKREMVLVRLLLILRIFV